MRRFTRKWSNDCSRGGGVAVMEVAQAGVRATGGRPIETEEVVANSGSVKRRKVNNGELRLSSSSSVRITARDGGDVINTSKKFGDPAVEGLSDPCGNASSFSSGDVSASCCSSNGSINEKLESADLDERAETETDVRYNLDRRESMPTSKFNKESGEPESPTTAKPSAVIDARHQIPAEKKPSAAELEEFFASAEKNLHKRFEERYNYDVVNDVPLKGRYDWVQLKP